jgi:hypothetical protein
VTLVLRTRIRPGPRVCRTCQAAMPSYDESCPYCDAARSHAPGAGDTQARWAIERRTGDDAYFVPVGATLLTPAPAPEACPS